eukprot:INCI2981.1.p1 GENE.INCI2981.1~~INCI2981.1.p1  ORF type:complete len:142 (+),score=20.27 INCI2981.1:915-1340(+)
MPKNLAKKCSSKRPRCVTPVNEAKPDEKVQTTAKRNRSADIQHKWSCFKTQAKRRNIAQQLSFEQYSTLVQLPCAYCGNGAVGQHAAYVGVDRIDSSIRKYSLQNCVPSCKVCNYMKGPLDRSDFLTKVREIAAWCTGVNF